MCLPRGCVYLGIMCALAYYIFWAGLIEWPTYERNMAAAMSRRVARAAIRQATTNVLDRLADDDDNDVVVA